MRQLGMYSSIKENLPIILVSAFIGTLILVDPRYVPLLVCLHFHFHVKGIGYGLL